MSLLGDLELKQARQATGTAPELPFPVQQIEPVGSRVTVDPPPTTTDEDWLALLPAGANLNEAATLLDESGWTWGGSAETALDDGGHCFTTFRDGDVNVIITTSAEFFRRFLVGRDICKRLNLTSKADRVYVHRRVRDDLDDRGPVAIDADLADLA